MKDLKPTCRVAVIQAAPLLFRKDACVEKAVSLILAGARLQAELIVFPELFIPGYPYGMTFGFTPGRGRPPGLETVLRQFHPGPRPGDGAAGAGRSGGRCLGQHRRQRAGRRHCHAV